MGAALNITSLSFELSPVYYSAIVERCSSRRGSCRRRRGTATISFTGGVNLNLFLIANEPTVNYLTWISDEFQVCLTDLCDSSFSLSVGARLIGVLGDSGPIPGTLRLSICPSSNIALDDCCRGGLVVSRLEIDYSRIPCDSYTNVTMQLLAESGVRTETFAFQPLTLDTNPRCGTTAGLQQILIGFSPS